MCVLVNLMSEYEICSYEAFRKRIRDDIRIIKNGKFNMIDEKRMNSYPTTVKSEKKILLRMFPKKKFWN